MALLTKERLVASERTEYPIIDASRSNWPTGKLTIMVNDPIDSVYIWNPETGIIDIAKEDLDLHASELDGIKSIWSEQREHLKDTRQLNRFLEETSREWAIETGIIENIYQIDRGITQTLIEQGFRAEYLVQGSTDKPREYVINLLKDQKDALDGIFDFIAQRREISTSYIKELHAALLRSQTLTEAVDSFGQTIEVELQKGEWKKLPNTPLRDGVAYIYCPPEHVGSEMDRLVDIHLTHYHGNIPPDVQAAWLHHRFTQIHPFQDGNGRIARALASLVLVRAGLFPLLVTRDNKADYIEALERADRGDLGPLVAFFAKSQRAQFRKATAVAEDILTEQDDVQTVLDGLSAVAEKKGEQRQQNLRMVFGHARALEDALRDRLENMRPQIVTALQRIRPNATVNVARSDDNSSHWYRSQIIENAREHLNYFANFREYRQWVSLNMYWERRAKIVFAIHGIGYEFSGSLVCAPFLEFKDQDDDELEPRSSLFPLTDEPFVFFYNESLERARKRFEDWREKVLLVAINELKENL